MTPVDPIQEMRGAYTYEIGHWEIIQNEERPFFRVVRWAKHKEEWSSGDPDFKVMATTDITSEAMADLDTMSETAAMRAALRALAEMEPTEKMMEASRFVYDGDDGDDAVRVVTRSILLAAAAEGENT